MHVDTTVSFIFHIHVHASYSYLMKGFDDELLQIAVSTLTILCVY